MQSVEGELAFITGFSLYNPVEICVHDTRIMAAEIAFLGQQLTNTDKVKKIAIFRAFLILKIESKHEAEIMSPFILVIFNIIFFH